jgi:hypothetical protein
LQIWFFNPKLRQLLYGLSQGKNEAKRIFIQLQTSKKPWISVVELVEHLGLQKNVQQDALEFSKLLTSHLEDLFKLDHHHHLVNPFTALVGVTL